MASDPSLPAEPAPGRSDSPPARRSRGLGRRPEAARPRWPVEIELAAGSTVRARIDGIPIEVASDDVALRSTPEAWATALCLPAARAGAVLRIGERVDRRWAEGAAANVALAASWWGGDAALPIDAPRRRWARRGSRPAGRALCFTGGVDSFFSLLRGDHRPTHLLYVLGFDVRLDDAPRATAVEATVREVAAAIGAEAAIVRTDLLAHPRFASVSWEHTHGAAIAAVAHLAEPIGTLVIPPSYHEGRLVPWGSRPDTDPRWSIPGRSEIVHGDASGRRIDRVEAIAADPLVARHLRVCWANVDGLLNCGRCEKCVRTMAMLAAVGHPATSATFPTAGDLAAAIDALDPLSPGTGVMWEDLLVRPLGAPERGAVERLLARSG